MSAIVQTKTDLSNEEIATNFERMAELLEAQQANPYRVQAYRKGAETIRYLPRPVTEILKSEGPAGLRRLPNIGESLARSIQQLVGAGKINLLQQLQGEVTPEQVLATVSGIGPILADRIHEQLHIETLTELESAAYDGRLDQVPGFGPSRLRGVRETLAGRLRHPPQRPKRPLPMPPVKSPPVAELLDVDREYRNKVKAGALPRIAPRRFNPSGEAWLPILHTERGSNHYTALFSNTARAHELGATRDWVVIYRDDEDGAGQWTVITSRFGSLQGRRIVRGREVECRQYYRQSV